MNSPLLIIAHGLGGIIAKQASFTDRLDTFLGTCLTVSPGNGSAGGGVLWPTPTATELDLVRNSAARNTTS